MATPRELLHAAYAKAFRNRLPNVVEEVEIAPFVGRKLQEYFSRGAELNPEYFGDDDDVPFDNGWPRPANAERVYLVEDEEGEEIVVLRAWERRLHPFEPAIVLRGRAYYPAGQQNDPSGTLTFFFSRLPTLPADLDTELDAFWPAQFNELLVLDLVIYLAAKDEARAAEAERWKADRVEWAGLFDAHVTHETARHGRAGTRA